MGEDSLGNGSESIAGMKNVAGLAHGGELPLPVGDGVEIDSPLEEETALLSEGRKRILKSVVDLGEKSRSELYAHQFARELDLVPHLDSVRHLVDLHAGLASVDPDDLSLEPRSARVDESDLVLGDGPVENNSDKVSVHTGHMSNVFSHIKLRLSVKRQKACRHSILMSL